jgi:hypothetical protein
MHWDPNRVQKWAALGDLQTLQTVEENQNVRRYFKQKSFAQGDVPSQYSSGGGERWNRKRASARL